MTSLYLSNRGCDAPELVTDSTWNKPVDSRIDLTRLEPAAESSPPGEDPSTRSTREAATTGLRREQKTSGRTRVRLIVIPSSPATRCKAAPRVELAKSSAVS